MITVTAAIIKKNGRILTARRKPGSHLAGYWEFPGGKLKAGETEQECLARELREEFGIECVVGDFLTESIYHYDFGTIRLRGYRVERVEGSFACREHDRLSWLTVEELRNLNWAPADLPILNKLLEIEWAASTLAYYRNNAASYVQETLANTTHLPSLEKFITLLPPFSHILDLGCGSGRDSRFLLDRGFRVTPSDASPEIAQIATDLLQLPVRVQRAEDLDDVLVYDGAWACAGLVHIPKGLMPKTFNRILKALKPGGIWYMSFKHGESEGRDNTRRFFNNYSITAIQRLLGRFPEARIIEIYESASSLRGKRQKWLNVYVAKEEV